MIQYSSRRWRIPDVGPLKAIWLSPSVFWTSSHVTQCHVRLFAVDLSGSEHRFEPIEPHDTQRLHHHADPDDLHRIRAFEGPKLNRSEHCRAHATRTNG